MGTTVIYNDVKLHNVVTREWEQEIVYDESNTDALYHKFRLRFEGILHADASGPAWTGVGTYPMANAVAQYADVHARLLRPRAGLMIQVSNAHAEDDPIILLQCWPTVPPSHQGLGNLNDADRDVDNGPKPMGFKILQVIGAKCFRVSFAIQCAKLVCIPAGTTVPLVLNNRWSVSEEMDENNFTTRTITGRLRLSCGVTAAELLTTPQLEMPQVFTKYLVVPGLEEGFRRERIEFSADQTGLECEYRITDRQVHTAAPWPATKMQARHTQTTSDGLTVVSEVHVHLEGPPHVDKKLLITRAIQVIDAKLNFVNRRAYQSWTPETISITDHIGEMNAVEVFARIQETAGQDAEIPKAMFLANMRMNMGEKLELPTLEGEPHEYDPGVSDPPAVFGYVPHAGERRPSVLLTLQCYLQQPCQDQHAIFTGNLENSDQDEEESRNTYTPFVTEGTSPMGYIPESSGDSWSESHKQSIYTYARISTRYLTNTCRVQLPIAYAPDDDAQSDTSKVFRIGRSQCRRVLEIDLERVGKSPQLPVPEDYYEDGDLKGRLLRHWIEPHPPSLAADGVSYVYRVTAYYLYALNRPPTLEESVRVGVAPQTNLTKDSDEAKFNPQNAYNGDLGP